MLWEFPLAYWMEQQGYDVSYISNLDTHSDPAGLLRAKGWLSVGHDEYWSLSMFETMKRMVSEGLNLAFLSGNSICGVIDIRASSDGRPGRIIERVGRFGSPRKEEIEKGFPEEALFTKNGPNEATLMGAQSTYPVTGGGDWTCRQPGHWLFAGTGMKEGDGIPGLVGWEWHGEPAPIPGLEVVASGKTQSPRAQGTYTATIYPGPKGNFVFNAATIWWADGLSAASRLCSPGCLYSPAGTRSARPADHAEFARTDARIVSIHAGHRLTAKTIHPPARRLCANQGAPIDAEDTSSSGKTSWILKPAPRSSRFSSPQR